MSYLDRAKAVETRLKGQDGPLVARLLGLPLDRFEREGSPLEIRVPWFEVTLWFAPTEADAVALGWEGISRGRVWTARELVDLFMMPGLTADQAQTIARAKVEFSGEIVAVRPRTDRGGKPA